MEHVHRGFIIKKLRLQKNITQEKLAAGIMDRAHLSHVESGRYDLSEVKLDAIMNRLGYVANELSHLALSDAENRIFYLRDKLSDSLSLHDYETAASLISEMEKTPGCSEGLHKQFLLRSKAVLCLGLGNDLDLVRTYLDEAISHTIPAFKEELVQNHFFTNEDVEIVSMMAEIYSIDGMYDNAVALLEKLMHSIKENVINAYNKARHLTLTMYNQSIYLTLQQKHIKALGVCDEAIRIGQNNRVYGLIPKLMASKACCLHRLGKGNESKDLFQQAYSAMLALGLETDATDLRNDSLIQYNIDIIA